MMYIRTDFILYTYTCSHLTPAPVARPSYIVSSPEYLQQFRDVTHTTYDLWQKYLLKDDVKPDKNVRPVSSNERGKFVCLPHAGENLVYFAKRRPRTGRGPDGWLKCERHLIRCIMIDSRKLLKDGPRSTK